MKKRNLSRRNFIGGVGASAAATTVLGNNGRRLDAEPSCLVDKTIIDTHIHMWKLPRSLPPMSDYGTYPGDPTDGFCCSVTPANPSGIIPWLQQDALMDNYLANWGGRRVSQVVLVTSSVGVTPAHVIQSNLWMLETAANDTHGPNGKSKILSVVGSLDTTEDPATFEQQLMELARNQLFVGIRLGDLGSILNGTSNPFPNNLKPNVLQNLKTMSTMGLQVDAIGLSGAVMAQVGQATGISIVMDHFANEGNTFRPSSAWMQDMQIAATYPGLHIKVSDVEVLSEAALGGYTFGPGQFQPIADPTQYYPVMEFLWNVFGSKRLLWGSNWPVCRYGGILTDPVDFEIDVWESFLAQKPAEGRNDVMYKNALRVYGPGSNNRR